MIALEIMKNLAVENVRRKIEPGVSRYAGDEVAASDWRILDSVSRSQI